MALNPTFSLKPELAWEKLWMPRLSIQPGSQYLGQPRILLYYPDFGAFGGIEHYILHVTSFLKSNPGFKPIVVCSAGGRLQRYLHENGIDTHGIHTLPLFRRPALRPLDLATQAQLWWILRREKPDVVHIQIGHIENLIFKLMGCKLVYTFHGYGSLYSLSETTNSVRRWLKKPFQYLFRHFIKTVDSLIFVSFAERNRLIEEQYLPDTVTSHVIHDGIDVHRWQLRAQNTNRTQVRQKLGIPLDTLCVSYIGRMVSNKNPLQFIQFAARMTQIPGFEKTHFLMVGSGQDESLIRKHVSESAVADQIHVLGHRSDIPELMAVSDALVFLSEREGFGLGVLEAAAAKTLFVTYAAGGIPEILFLPETQRLMVPVGDEEALFARLIQLLQWPQEKKDMVQDQLGIVAKQFTLANMMQSLEAVYQDVMHD